MLRRMPVAAVVAAVATVLALLAVVGLGTALLDGHGGDSRSRAPRASHQPAPPRSGAPAGPSARPARHHRPACRPGRPFQPVRLRIAGLLPAAPVIAVGSTGGQVGAPPVTEAGKRMVAWYAGGRRPGETLGHVVLDVHTWPDGTALGNLFLRRLHRGASLRLDGGGLHACYRLSRRIEVPADTGRAAAILSRSGPPAVVIIACSGQRLGPGQWTHRTIWFARPVAVRG